MHWFSTIRSDTRGSLTIIVALSVSLLVAVGGSAIDFGRYQLVKSRLQEAVTAAAIATAAMPAKKADGTDFSPAERLATFNRYFAVNYPAGYLGVSVGPPTAAITNDAIVVNMSNIAVPTTFLRALGINQLTFNSNVEVQTSSSGNSTPYEIILVLDTSGSMSSNNKIGLMRAAANRMIANILNPNLSNSRMAAILWSNRLKGVQNLTADVSLLSIYTNGMRASGGTLSTIGLNAALAMVPQFRPDTVRAVVLLTDGVNSDPSSTNRSSLAICNQFKAMNPPTFVYTIAFGPDAVGNRTIRNFLSDCASGPRRAGNTILNENTYFFSAGGGPELDKAFAVITSSVKKIKITK